MPLTCYASRGEVLRLRFTNDEDVNIKGVRSIQVSYSFLTSFIDLQ